MDIAKHVQGEPTANIPASLSSEATTRFDQGHGLVEIDVGLAKAGGASFIDHINVVQAVKRSGDLKAVRDAKRAEEVLLRYGIPAIAIRLIR